MAQYPPAAGGNGEGVFAQVRAGALGRDHKRTWQVRFHHHQCPRSGFVYHCPVEAIPVGYRNLISQWQTSKHVEVFPLGQADTTGQLEIPQQLYGREHEIGALIEAFKRVSGGASELMLVYAPTENRRARRHPRSSRLASSMTKSLSWNTCLSTGSRVLRVGTAIRSTKYAPFATRCCNCKSCN